MDVGCNGMSVNSSLSYVQKTPAPRAKSCPAFIATLYSTRASSDMTVAIAWIKDSFPVAAMPVTWGKTVTLSPTYAHTTIVSTQLGSEKLDKARQEKITLGQRRHLQYQSCCEGREALRYGTGGVIRVGVVQLECTYLWYPKAGKRMRSMAGPVPFGVNVDV
jgi:uncharacterized protein (DUF2132 family)